MSADSFSPTSMETDGVESPPTAPDDTWAGLADIGELWFIPLLVGIASVVFGALVVAWPDVTIKVVAVIFGIQLIVYGAFRIVQSLAADETAGGQRVLLAIIGVLALVVGILCLRNLLQAVQIIALLLGLFWLVGGVLQIVAALSRGARRRGLGLLTGSLSALAGILVLLYPDISLLTLAVILGLWLMIFGVLAVIESFAVRGAIARHS